MTFKEKTVVGILLVARIMCEDERVADEIKKLANHISVWGKPPDDA